MGNKIDLSSLITKKTKDYSYTIAFFLIFSFFLFFVIRPNILAIFRSNLEVANLTKTNAFYESQIQNVILSQTMLEAVRDDLYLVDEALTSRPDVNDLINDLTETINKNQLLIDKISLTNVELKNITKSDQMKTIAFDVQLVGGFEQFRQLMDDLYSQRRLKTISNITIDRREIVSTSSGDIRLIFDLESYYL